MSRRPPIDRRQSGRRPHRYPAGIVVVPPSPLFAEPWSARAADLVLVQARALQGLARDRQPLLRGKQFGLLCDDAADPSALLFRRACGALGAHVSLVRPLRHEADDAGSFDDTARLLGRLYDAIECQGPATALVQLLRERVGIPVFAGSATPEHPSVRLIEQLDGSPAERRECVLQALLIVSLS